MSPYKDKNKQLAYLKKWHEKYDVENKIYVYCFARELFTKSFREWMKLDSSKKSDLYAKALKRRWKKDL